MGFQGLSAFRDFMHKLVRCTLGAVLAVGMFVPAGALAFAEGSAENGSAGSIDTDGSENQAAAEKAASVTTVRLHGAWGAGAETREFSVPSNTMVDLGAVGYVEPWSNGYAFAGWNVSADGTGSWFDFNSNAVPNTDVCDLYSIMAPIQVSSSVAAASVDVSNMSLAVPTGYTSVIVKLDVADKCDARLSIDTDSYKALNENYSLRILAARDLSFLQSAIDSISTMSERQWSESFSSVSHITNFSGSLGLLLPKPKDANISALHAAVLGSDGGDVANVKCTDAGELASFQISGDTGIASTSSANIAMVSKLTKAEKELMSAKKSYKEKLKKLYLGYHTLYKKGFYSGNSKKGDWAELLKAYKDGDAEIDAATTIKKVQKAYNEAKDAMADVPMSSPDEDDDEDADDESDDSDDFDDEADDDEEDSDESDSDDFERRNYNVMLYDLLGAFFKDADDETIEGLDEDSEYGAYAERVIDGGAFSKAGLREGDVVTSIMDGDVKEADDEDLDDEEPEKDAVPAKKTYAAVAASEDTQNDDDEDSDSDDEEDLEDELDSIEQDEDGAYEISDVNDLGLVLSSYNEGDELTFTVMRNGQTVESKVVLGKTSLSETGAVSTDANVVSDNGSRGWVPIVLAGLVAIAAAGSVIWWITKKREFASASN